MPFVAVVGAQCELHHRRRSSHEPGGFSLADSKFGYRDSDFGLGHLDKRPPVADKAAGKSELCWLD